MVYIPPDLRKQSIQDAMRQIEAARAKRMVMRQSFEEATKAKLDKQKDAEMTRLQRRAEMLDKALDNVVAAIEKAEKRLSDYQETHSNLVNIETHD